MNLVQKLRAALKAKMEAFAAIKEKAFADGSKAEDVTAFETAMAEIEALEKQLDLAVKAEELEARQTKAAGAPLATASAETTSTVEARPKEDYPLSKTLALCTAAVIKAGKDGDAEKVLIADGYQGFVDQLKAAQRKSPKQDKSVNTLVSAEGGILVPTPQPQGGIVPLLRAESTFINAGPNRIQLVNGQFNQVRGATGATASYVGEGAKKAVSTPTFDAIAMKSRKIAGIVPITNEARKWTVGNIADYVENDLRAAIALAMDTAAYFGTGTGANPLGIFRRSGIVTYTPTFATATAPTLAEIDAMATGMLLALTTANIPSRGKWRWFMSWRTAMRLGNYRVGNGADGLFAFPGMQGADNLVFKNLPVIVTNVNPTNGGGTTDETTLGLINMDDVLFGEEEGIIVKMSDQATLDVDGAGTLVHLFQQNMFAILAEAEHDFGLRRAISVVKATIRF